MATLERIRKHGVLLLIVVGAALLIFIIGDFISSSSNYFAEKKANVAIINGDKIKIQDYQNNLDQLNEVVKLEQGTISDEMSEQIRSINWEATVLRKTIYDECNKIGMTITENELTDLLMGNNVSPLISSNRMFIGADGAFDVENVKNFYNTVFGADFASQAPEQAKTYKTWWNYWKDAAEMDRMQEKYTNLISKSLVVNKLEAKNAYNATHLQTDVVYAIKGYYTINDSTINVPDSKIKELYKARKEQFKQEQSADIAYIAVDIVPSADDYKAVADEMASIAEEFATTEDMISFTYQNSEEQYHGDALIYNEVDADLAEFAFSAAKNTIFEPQLFEDTYKMARVMETGIEAPDSVKLSHIIVMRDDEASTQALADSLQAAIAAGSDFAALAREFSLAQTAQNGGEIGWLTARGLEANIATPAFSTPKGKMFQVKDGNAINLFYVNEVGKKVKKVKLAVISKKVTASSATRTDLYSQLKNFVANNNSLEKFNESASESGYTVMTANNVNINASNLNDIRKAREVVRWAFENKVGAVSEIYEVEERIIAAAVTAHHKEGYRPLESVRSQLYNELANDAKAEVLFAEMEGKTIEELAALDYRVDTVRNISFASNYVGSIGAEYSLLARIADAEEGVESAPVKGKGGAYIFKVISKNETEQVYDEKEEIIMLSARQNYMAQRLIIETLKTAAKIKDLRYKYY